MAVATMGLIACNTSDLEETPLTPNTTHDVVLRASHGSLSRTELGESDGSTQAIRWSVGDQLLAWAESASTGTYAFEGTTFTLGTYNATYESADFMATVGAMEEGTYTYHAVYPTPETRTGTEVSYTLPAQQRGTYDPALDVMTATTTGNALLPRTTTQTEIGWQEPELHFAHLFHLVRIRIPEGKNLLGQPIKRLDVIFPQEVVGTVTFDVKDPVGTATWSNLTNKITVELPDNGTIDAGSGYIWLHIKPGTLTGELAFQAYNIYGVPSAVISTSIDKTFASQRVTPVALTIPESPLSPITYLDIRETANHLGEAWQTMSLSGYSFVVPYTTTTISTLQFTPNASNSYKVAVCASNTTLQNQTLTVKYESEHTLFDDVIHLPSSLTNHASNRVNQEVPYLLAEDFSGLSANFAYDDAYTASAQNNTSVKGYLLDGLMPENGWNISHGGGKAGLGVRINVRYQSGAWVVGRYCGRLDTPALSKLKASANVSIRVQYDMGCYVPKGYNTDDRTNAATTCLVGLHNNSQSSALNGENQNNVAGAMNLLAYTSSAYTSAYTNDSYGSSFPTTTFTVGGVGNTTRVVWWATTSQSSSKIAANCAYYLYIDNIKISIANE